MRNATRTSGRRIWHDEHGSALEQILHFLFLDVTGELDRRMRSIFFLHRLDITGSLGMIASGDDEFHIRKTIGNSLERVNHQLQFLVRAPFSEGQDALRIFAS